MAVGYGLGSIAFPFATMLFGHAASTFFLFAAFYALWRARGRGAGHGPWLAVLAGFLGGWAVLSDLSCGLGVVILGVYALLAGPDHGRWGGSRVPFLRRVDLRTPFLVRASAGSCPPPCCSRTTRSRSGARSASATTTS